MLKKGLKNNYLHIGIILSLGILSRLYMIGAANLWRDEAFSVLAAKLKINELISVHLNDTSPPLHTLILHYWIKLFGSSELSVRLPSAIFGVLTIIFIYEIAKHTFHNKYFAKLVFLLAAINPILIYYSQETRNYSLLIFFSIAALYLAIQIAKATNPTFNLLFFNTLITTLGLYTNNLFLFVTFINCLIILISFSVKSKIKLKRPIILQVLSKKKEYIIKIFLSYFISGIIFLPWLIILKNQVGTVSNTGFWLKFDPINSTFEVLSDIFHGLTYDTKNFLEETSVIFLTFFGILFLISSSLSAIGLFGDQKLKKEPQIKILIFWFWALFIISWLYSYTNTSVFYIRYLVFLVPIAIIITVYFFDILIQIKKSLAIILIILFLASNLILDIYSLPRNSTSKTRMSDLVRELDFKEGDLILHTHAYTHHDFDYYSNYQDFIYNPKRDLPYFEGLALIKDSDYYPYNKISESKRVWVIYLWHEEDSLKEELSKSFVMKKQTSYTGNLHLELWEKIE